MKLPASQDPAVQELLDREAIRDCMYRYCRGIDRCDAKVLASAYWPGAVDDHIFWKGTIEEFIPWVMPILRSRDQTKHAISNILIRIDGSEARVESYFDAYERAHRNEGKDGKANDIFASGRYLDHMENRAGEWRIARRKVVMDWFRILDDSADWERGMFGKPLKFGARGNDDPSHDLFGQRVAGN